VLLLEKLSKTKVSTICCRGAKLNFLDSTYQWVRRIDWIPRMDRKRDNIFRRLRQVFLATKILRRS
jgi:hypothetical protein